MGIWSFILTVVGISLSGVMAPGPITAATLAAGARNRHAGAMICLGHVLVELPLIVLLAAGLGAFLASNEIRAGIGLAGGAVLLWMGAQLLASLRRPDGGSTASAARRPLWTGVVLSGANPYFLLWWATVGLAVAGRAMEFGILGLVLFAAVHWTCDLAWLEVLSLAGHKGSEALGSRVQKTICAVCAVALLGFGVKFICDGAAGVWT